MTNPVTVPRYGAGMTIALAEPIAVTRAPSWRGEPTHELAGRFGQLAARVPRFDRTGFGTNPRLDTIVRRAAHGGGLPLPAGVVSKRYALVQHTDVLDALAGALVASDIDPHPLACTLTLTESGTRMALRVALPDALAYTPRDGLADAKRDQAALAGLADRRVTTDRLQDWVDDPVARAWGPCAATRVYTVATRGVDGDPSRHPKGARPHARPMLHATAVPGSRTPCEDAYGVTQALAWVASRRTNVPERETWRGQIAELVAQL